MDLAVVAALIAKEDLPAKAHCVSRCCSMKSGLPSASISAKMVDSRASLIRRGQDWILSLSGGVQIDPWSVLNRVEMRSEMKDAHRRASRGQ